MDEKQYNQLRSILDKRQSKLNTLRHFDRYWERFSGEILRDVVKSVNMELNSQTQENLKILYNDPFRALRSPYFVALQLISDIYHENQFILDRANAPLLKFEADGQSSDVNINLSINEEDESIGKMDIQKLDHDSLFETIVIFIDRLNNI